MNRDNRPIYDQTLGKETEPNYPVGLIKWQLYMLRYSLPDQNRSDVFTIKIIVLVLCF